MQKVADWCYEAVHQDHYTWEVIGDAFLQVVNRTLTAPIKYGRKRKIKEA
jgi:hypothetical protein